MTMGDRLAIMNDGVLQQTGRPSDVYANPRSEFVGGFVGSPSMNNVDVTVEDAGDGVTLRNGDRFAYSLTGERADRVADAGVQRARLGIRPENVAVVDDRDGIGTTVEVVEPVGSDNYLHLDLGEEFIARVASGIEPEPGEVIYVTFDESDVHLFDSESGESLLFDGERERTAATV